MHLRAWTVSVQRRTDWHIGQWLGISLLIAGVVRVPLPQADYHNVRHHDGPGEICRLHDHLLRWHPSASSDADVALLHWHWFLPLAESDDPNQRTSDERHGPVLHAHVCDWPEPDWLDGPMINPDVSGRFFRDVTPRLAAAESAFLSGHFVPTSCDPDFFLVVRNGAGDAVRAERSALLQRWNC